MKKEIRVAILTVIFCSCVCLCFLSFFGGMEMMVWNYRKDWYMWMNGAVIVCVGIPVLVSVATLIGRRLFNE